ncbi:MAG: methylmalonyl-CoA epimerase [Pseudomonadota bacterium]
MLGKLNHVAIACADVAAASALYRTIGAAVSAPDDLPEHGVRVVFVTLDNTKIELLEPLGETSPIAPFLAKNPTGGLHHVCYEVADLSAAIAAVTAAGARVLGAPKIGAHGKPVVFIHPKDVSGVLTELEEV